MEKSTRSKGREEQMTIDEKITAEVLRTIARDEQIKESVLRSSSLYPLLLAAAKRYVTGETRQEALSRAKDLEEKGYCLSVEYIGENTLDAEACGQVKDEFLSVIDDCSVLQRPVGISFDLSHVGLMVSQEQAFAHVEEMAVAAARSHHDVMISMEESAKTEAIIAMYERLAKRHENVGITIQAHLHRSVEDVQRVLKWPGKIRLVKGAFKEPRDIALPRSTELNERYLQLAEMCVHAGKPCAFATHDQVIIEELQKRDYFSPPRWSWNCCTAYALSWRRACNKMAFLSASISRTGKNGTCICVIASQSTLRMCIRR